MNSTLVGPGERTAVTPNSTLTFLEHTFTVLEKEMSSFGVLGRFDIAKEEISVDKDLAGDVYLSTILHEVVHGIYHILAVEHEEEHASGMAVGMMSFIRNNPDFIAMVLGIEEEDYES